MNLLVVLILILVADTVLSIIAYRRSSKTEKQIKKFRDDMTDRVYKQSQDVFSCMNKTRIKYAEANEKLAKDICELRKATEGLSERIKEIEDERASMCEWSTTTTNKMVELVGEHNSLVNTLTDVVKLMDKISKAVKP